MWTSGRGQGLLTQSGSNADPVQVQGDNATLKDAAPLTPMATEMLAMGKDLAGDGTEREGARESSDTGRSCAALSSDESSEESSLATRSTPPRGLAPADLGGVAGWGGGGASSSGRSSPISTPPERAAEKRREGDTGDHARKWLRLRHGKEWTEKNAERPSLRGAGAKTTAKRAQKTAGPAPPLQKEGSSDVGREGVPETTGKAAREGGSGAKEKKGKPRHRGKRGAEHAKELLPWHEKLKKMGLEERYRAGAGRRKVSLYHALNGGKKLVEVAGGTPEDKWWCMNQPRRHSSSLHPKP